jgi:hypothetical protein
MPRTERLKGPPLAERRGRAAAIAPDASAVAATAFARAGFPDATLVLRWTEIVGAQVADVARPIRLDSSGVLTLKAEPGAAVFLQHQSRVLAEQINAYLGKPMVARLRFVHGALQKGPPPPPVRRPQGPVPASDPALRYQGPEGLHAALLKLAGARQKDEKRDD